MSDRKKSTSTTEAEAPRPRHPNWGGPRPGSGRKPKGDKPGVPHHPRPTLSRRSQVHVLLSFAPDVRAIRRTKMLPLVEEAVLAATDRFSVLLRRFALEEGRVHLLVEASSNAALAAAMKGFSVRLARAINRQREAKGRVIADRYTATVLRGREAIPPILAAVADVPRKTDD